MTARQRQFKWLLTPLFCVLVLDQITKAIVLATIEVNPGYRDNTFFYFTHQRNSGLVGGMFSDYPYVTLVAPVIATLTLIYLFRHLDPASRLQSLAFGNGHGRRPRQSYGPNSPGLGYRLSSIPFLLHTFRLLLEVLSGLQHSRFRDRGGRIRPRA